MYKLTEEDLSYAEEFLTSLCESSGWADLKAIEILQTSLDNERRKLNIAGGNDFTYLANQLVG